MLISNEVESKLLDKNSYCLTVSNQSLSLIQPEFIELSMCRGDGLNLKSGMSFFRVKN